MQTAILTIKPIDDHGTIDDEKECQIEIPWDNDTAMKFGGFIVENVNRLCAEIIGEDEDESRYVESLPAFDMTLELRQK